MVVHLNSSPFYLWRALPLNIIFVQDRNLGSKSTVIFHDDRQRTTDRLDTGCTNENENYKMTLSPSLFWNYTLAAVVHLNFRTGWTFPVPVCTVSSSKDRTSRWNKVDAVRLYALYRLNLLFLKKSEGECPHFHTKDLSFKDFSLIIFACRSDFGLSF